MPSLDTVEMQLKQLEAKAETVMESVNLKAKRKPWVFVSGGIILGFCLGLFF